ncbi:AI-2E family transporter [Haloterrigena salifodinae]|uniref:AI-2E family transporter n=1 Tax=Haloterrigena salifodinae TaxID=2675099 RepID=A0A8T8E441_9EURY|nr:AI-2E family transporter [Haloterrigena salifodinae]QRV16498.1 AI-2E family transporter [Haloterrigena salifodinae]
MNISKGFLLALVAVLAFLSWLLIAPFLQYALIAVLLAYILRPLQRRLEQRTSPMIAAMALVLLTITGFVIPLAIILTVVIQDATRIVENLNTDSVSLTEVESFIQEQTGVSVDLMSSLMDAARQGGQMVLEQSTAWLSALTHALIGFGLALFLLYYLLKDGNNLISWIRKRTPLPDDVQDDLYEELDEVMQAVLIGHVLIALVQGLLAGIGLIATGIPNAAFWTVIMVVLALIPIIGTFLVWGPAVIFLLATGEPLLAVGLFVYSTVIVGLSDDYLRPLVVDRYAELNPAVIIVGVLGGAYAFGFMGLFFGPVILGALRATLTVFHDNYERLEREKFGG